MEEREEIGVAEMKDYDLTKIPILCALALLLRYKKQKLSLGRRGGGKVVLVLFLLLTLCELLTLFCD